MQTGLPIMAHSQPSSGTGLEQMRIFSEEGVDPARVQIAHTGDTDDLDYIERLLDTGCWIGMDRYGLDMFLPTEQRNATVLALLERGYADRMFLVPGLLLDDRLVPARGPGLPQGAARSRLVDDLPLREGDPRAQATGHDRR